MAYLLQELLTTSSNLYPDNEAVVYQNESLTYAQLDEHSTRLAVALREGGVEKGDRVGIHFSKRLESLIAIFGVLKAGAVYVPLDPSAPIKRVAYIIENCGMKALISTDENASNINRALPETSSVKCTVLIGSCSLDHLGEGPLCRARMIAWSEAMQMPVNALTPTEIKQDDLAYVLYTSGSTGEPKGVMISHRASLTFVDWSYEAIEVRTSDRVSSHAPLHFDLSIFDIFTTIEAGATVVLIPEELSIFPRNLADFIHEQRISVWYSVPSALTRMILTGNLERHSYSSLRKVLFAGEVFPIKYLRQLKKLIPHAEYYNLYGPTETNVCTFYKVDEVSADRVEPLPIGKACAKAQTFVVNDRNEVVGPGEVGELYVRGPSVMTGYWGMPDKTAKVLCDFGMHSLPPDENTYRTGDLVREDEDGNYIFLGRRDNMIKSRGYRIELGEIESSLYSHPKVEEVAVIAIPNEEIGNVIKALIVPRDDADLTRSDLESHCAERIPKYMIPSIFEFRRSLPKISTGKTDRTLLIKEHVAGTSE